MVEVIWVTCQCNMRTLELTKNVLRHHGVMASALCHHVLNHSVPLTVHEAALRKITVLEASINSTISKNHSLINKFKDLGRKASATEERINSYG